MRTRQLLLLTTAVCALWAAPARAQSTNPAPKAPTNDDCLACHGDPSAARSDGRPVAVAADQFAASIHGQSGIACVDCHADLAKATEFPHAEKLAPVACAGCHGAQTSEYDASVHAEARRAAVGSVAATCTDCHGVHDIRPAKDPESRTYHLNLPRTCGRCHGNADIIKRGKIAIGDVVQRFQDSIHGQALLRSGLLVAPNCSDCHGAHGVRRKNNPESRVNRVNVPATCGRCHQGVETRYEAGIHGTLLRKGNQLTPVCADCHSAHDIRRVDAESWRLQVINECGTCHAESMRTYRDTFHGQVTSLGFVRVAMCADCHRAHDVFPLRDARSSIAPANLVKTCQKCHANANASFVQYDPHAARENRQRNPTLYFAGRFMDALLVGVFGFFGVHTVIWFSRSLRERRRGRQVADAVTVETEKTPDEHRGE